MGVQQLLTIAIGPAVTLFISAIVWITLVAGLFQLVGEGINRLRVELLESRRSLHTSSHYLRSATREEQGKATQHV